MLWDILKKSVEWIAGWFKRHLLIGTALFLFLLYVLFELVTTFVVVCRDAYITTDIVVVAPEVSGPMLNLGVTNDQALQEGALLFSIEPEPFQIELDSQNAALGLARAELEQARDRIRVMKSEIEAKQADLDDASENRQRGLELLKRGAVAQETFDNLQRNFQVAAAALAQSQASKVVAEQTIAVQSAQVRQIETAVAKAKYELTRTQVRSPVSGRVAPFQVRAGSFLEAGKPVLAIVKSDHWRIVANLSERHLSGLEPGHQVWFSLGSDPWRIHRGRIRSIAPGIARSPNAVNVLPFVETNTDWIRLPRRFPIEIDIGDLPSTRRLFMGADATVWWIK
jgi:membrane fusion protein, multidrug efflux system